MFIEINQEVMEESIDITENEVFAASSVMRRIGVKAEYVSRFDEFRTLGIDENGETSFPVKYKPYFLDAFNAKLYTEKNNHDCRATREMAGILRNHVTNDDIMANRTPNSLLEYLNEFEYSYWDELDYKTVKITDTLKGLKTPKLSRFLVKLFGEQANIVSYYNSLPRKIKKDDRYRVHISVLPHHIAGMSYYSSHNHGGSSWQGQDGTSCQDTKGAGYSDMILRVPTNLKDATLGIAWLSHVEDDCVYQARSLIRLVKHEGKPFFVMCRTYGTSNETRHILRNALLEEYDNIEDRETWGASTMNNISIELPESVRMTWEEKEECDSCDGEGKVESEETCEICDMHGEVPCAACENGCDECDDTGYVDCSHCEDGYVWTTEDCSSCGGEGQIVVIEHVKFPYIDESITFNYKDSGETIHCNIPVDVLEKYKKEEEVAV